ncbi:MAG: carboxypeptidase M32 [Deltaproteobacteria bacterium]|nr:carboxypeptidase M32 [Deltaproteobacteria bacterium]
MKLDTAWNSLTERLSELETLEGLVGLLEWDQQTNMPARGGSNRGEQMALLSRTAHQRLTDPRVGEWLGALEAAPALSEVQAAALRNTRREYDRAVRVAPDLVERIARSQARGFESWISAKQSADFTAFAPALGELVELVAERARSIDDGRPVYDVLLDEFDPGTSTETLRSTFGHLREGLVELIGAVSEVPALPALDTRLDRAAQRALQEEVVAAIGFSFDEGRLDEAEHPFTVGIGQGDVRITTHIYDDNVLSGLGGAVHEAGHAMYEQGLPHHLRGTSVARAASMGLHESQSRLWENFIGRSMPFFRWLEPLAARHFPGEGITAERLYQAANRVSPGLIRVAADEVTYNLHIIVRFELELALFSGLRMEELPELWNERYREFLGVLPHNDGVGVLQDVHWASGAFGYFPSYTLGNLYAAGLGETLLDQHPALWAQVEAGDFAPTLRWLREKVHSRGHIADAPQIVTDAIGRRDLVESLLSYLWDRHGALHGVRRPVR